MRKYLPLFLLVLLPVSAHATILDSSRIVTWRGNVGVEGGIPARLTVCATIDSGTYADNTTDATAEFQTKINACTAGQTVSVPAGWYRLAGQLTLKSSVTLRGEGRDNTVLRSTYTSSSSVKGPSGSGGSAQAIVSGYDKGATSLVVTSGASFAAGDVVAISQLDNTDIVDHKTCTWCGLGGNEARCMAQLVEVASVDGNTVTLDVPLYWTLASALSPQIQKVGIGLSYAGVEDLKFDFTDANGSSGTGNISFAGAKDSWLKNVEIYNVGGQAIRAQNSYRNEIRDSYIHHAHSYGSGVAYGTMLFDANSAWLVENNVFDTLRHAMVHEGGGSGNVYGYNYSLNPIDQTVTWLSHDAVDGHGAHPFYNLWEGNIIAKFGPDYTWGSSSHGTAFRNWITREPRNYGKFTVDLQKRKYYYNIVGNILGTAGKSGTMGMESSSGDCGTGNVVWRLGCSSAGDGSNPPPDYDQVVATLIRHGNYSYVGDEIVWDGGIADHVLPDSYYLTEAPSWWCEESGGWPNIGSDITGYINNIPAKISYESGTCTPIGGEPPPDTIPNSFTFGIVTNVELSTLSTSGNVTITGITAGQTPAISISGAGCTYNIDGGAYTAGAGTVGLDNVVSVKTTSSGSYSTSVICTLTVGGVAGTYTVTTKAASPPAGGGTSGAPTNRGINSRGGWN